MRLSEACLWHLDAILPDMRPDEIEQYLAVTGETDYCPVSAAYEMARIVGPRWSIVDNDGKPLVTGGVQWLREGVGRAWMAGTMQAWQQHGIGITRICRKNFERCIDGGHFDRIEILALPHREGARDWYVRGLRFEYEGLRKRYHHGHDFVAYAKTRA